MPPSRSDDVALLQAATTGEPAAWRAFLERFTPLFVHIIRQVCERYGHPTAAAELDAVTSDLVFALVKEQCAKLKAYRAGPSVSTYLGVITRSITIDYIRRYRVRHTVGDRYDPAASSVAGLDDRADPRLEEASALLERTEVARAVDAALGGLKPKEQLMIKLFYQGGKKYREIAEILDVPLNTVCSTLARSLAKLRGHLRDVPEVRDVLENWAEGAEDGPSTKDT